MCTCACRSLGSPAPPAASLSTFSSPGRPATAWVSRPPLLSSGQSHSCLAKTHADGMLLPKLRAAPPDPAAWPPAAGLFRSIGYAGKTMVLANSSAMLILLLMVRPEGSGLCAWAAGLLAQARQRARPADCLAAEGKGKKAVPPPPPPARRRSSPMDSLSCTHPSRPTSFGFIG